MSWKLNLGHIQALDTAQGARAVLANGQPGESGVQCKGVTGAGRSHPKCPVARLPGPSATATHSPKMANTAVHPIGSQLKLRPSAIHASPTNHLTKNDPRQGQHPTRGTLLFVQLTN